MRANNRNRLNKLVESAQRRRNGPLRAATEAALKHLTIEEQEAALAGLRQNLANPDAAMEYDRAMALHKLAYLMDLYEQGILFEAPEGGYPGILSPDDDLDDLKSLWGDVDRFADIQPEDAVWFDAGVEDGK